MKGWWWWFFQMLFLCLLRCSFCPLLIYHILLIWYITLIDFLMWNQIFIPGINPWCVIFFVCCWIWFACSILLRISASVLIRNIDLWFSCDIFLFNLWTLYCVVVLFFTLLSFPPAWELLRAKDVYRKPQISRPQHRAYMEGSGDGDWDKWGSFCPVPDCLLDPWSSSAFGMFSSQLDRTLPAALFKSKQHQGMGHFSCFTTVMPTGMPGASLYSPRSLV